MTFIDKIKGYFYNSYQKDVSKNELLELDDLILEKTAQLAQMFFDVYGRIVYSSKKSIDKEKLNDLLNSYSSLYENVISEKKADSVSRGVIHYVTEGEIGQQLVRPFITLPNGCMYIVLKSPSDSLIGKGSGKQIYRALNIENGEEYALAASLKCRHGDALIVKEFEMLKKTQTIARALISYRDCLDDRHAILEKKCNPIFVAM